MLRVLEKLGHSTVVAATGIEVVSMTAKQEFDLVFMDIHLPELDGLAATAAIRGREKISALHLPILAMTVDAMTGDRERCLEAGMDGYVSKPVHLSEIEQVLEGWMRTPRPQAPGVAHPPWNKLEVLNRLDGDEELFRELIQVFLVESPKLVEELRHAVCERNSDAVMRAAHSIKGELSYLGADAATQAAQQLEAMGRDHDLSRTEEILALLRQELERLYVAIRDPAGVGR